MAHSATVLNLLVARHWAAALAAGASVVAAVLAGCNAGPAVVGGNPEAKAAMTVLGLQYGEFLAAHNGKAPKDEAEMRAFLEARLEDLKMYNVTSVDQLLSAGRDGKPIKIVCGTTVSTADQAEYLWAAYEAEGLEGSRLAVNMRGSVYELTADEFGKQLPGQ